MCVNVLAYIGLLITSQLFAFSAFATTVFFLLHYTISRYSVILLQSFIHRNSRELLKLLCSVSCNYQYKYLNYLLSCILQKDNCVIFFYHFYRRSLEMHLKCLALFLNCKLLNLLLKLANRGLQTQFEFCDICICHCMFVYIPF